MNHSDVMGREPKRYPAPRGLLEIGYTDSFGLSISISSGHLLYGGSSARRRMGIRFGQNQATLVLSSANRSKLILIAITCPFRSRP